MDRVNYKMQYISLCIFHQLVCKYHLKVSHSLTIDLDLTWKVSAHGHKVNREVYTTLHDIPKSIDDC